MNVLSLFDGMSCGRIALERAGVKVDNYFASEIKNHAIKVAKENYPDIKHIGNVLEIKGEDFKNIDLLIGGSPCQDLSIANLKREGLKGNKSSLFFQWFRLYTETKPKYFLLENVSMKKEDRDIISQLLGVEAIEINSNLVSFQNRKRLYWTNIPNVTAPSDKKISFQDNKSTLNLELYKVKRTPSREKMWESKCPNVTFRDKINCLTCKQDRWANAGLVEYEDFCRYLTVEECEKAQTVPVGYTKCLSKSQAYDVLGDGWTVDVIAHIFKGLK